ncbi:hypothetical protein [Nocardioides sp. CER19]|uniref:hypothetical protein n=1 Tax=Nocardioides sp. CER19 TaxID=3038538 RepID=UPI00244CE35A|nr:hypothetical protein [Nocardioides sp. CER19]MDH2416210.1 hypothetical protein [Nocardioides sp. CER19]
MDELDNLATDPLGSLAPGAAQVATALDLLSDLLGTAPARTQRWEPRDRGNGLNYRLWDALPLVHTIAATHQVTEAEAVHAIQAAVRQVKTDDDTIDVLTEHLAELGVGSLRDFMGRTIELETHAPLNLGAYALSVVDSATMQDAYAHTAAALCRRALPTLPPQPTAA